jgi:hypothetical protein
MGALDALPPELEKFWRTDDGMTACERAEAYGIDLSLLRDNLRLPVGQRLAGNDGLLEASEALRAAYLKTRESTDTNYNPPR